MKSVPPIVLWICLVACPLAAIAEPETEAGTYGFRGLEIYKLERGIFGLRTADVDGDGRQDLLVVNNAKARIDVFLRREKPVRPPAKIGEEETNKIGEDRYFQREKLLTEKTVTSMATGDLDADGNVDVVFVGKPNHVAVAYGDGKGGFARRRTFEVKGASEARGALDIADLNGDGRHDLVLLAKDRTIVWAQGEDHVLGAPEEVPYSAKKPTAVGGVDVDGDGRMDLVMLSLTEARSVRVRYQRTDGRLGPEVAYELPQIRTIGFEELDPARGNEVLVIQQTSGLLRVLGLAGREPGGGSGIPLGGVRVHPFDAGRGSRKRSMDIGDVDGDGRNDIVVTDPDAAQVALYLQTDDGRLATPRRFPSLAESDDVRLVGLDGDLDGGVDGGKSAIAVLSRKEKAVGLSALGDDGRLPFPALLEVPGAPQAIDAGDLDGDGKPELAVLTKVDKVWKVVVLATSGAIGKTHELKGLDSRKDTPGDILIHDLDRDGRVDLLLFDGYNSMRVFRQGDDGGFADVSAAPAFRSGLVSKKKRADVSPVDLDGDGKLELLVSAKNFARALVLGKGGALEILEQVNGRTPTSVIKGAVALDVTGDGKAEVALLDSSDNTVSVFRRGEGGVFRSAASIPVGDFAFERIRAEDVNGDGKRDLIVLGARRFGVLYAGGEEGEFAQKHSFESPIRKAFLSGWAIGDFNHDGRPDLALTEVGNNTIEIVSYDPKTGVKHQLKWRVFEEKGHDRPLRGRRGEPREIVCADFDADGKDDLAIIVHDRMIVYLQE